MLIEEDFTLDIDVMLKTYTLMRSCKDPMSLPRLHSIKSPPSIIPQTRALFDVAHDPTFGDPGPSNTHTAFLSLYSVASPSVYVYVLELEKKVREVFAITLKVIESAYWRFYL